MEKEYKNMAKKDLTYKLCTKCNFFCGIFEADIYCSVCGAQLIDKCPTCSNKITNPYAKFCKYCGMAYPGKIITKNKFL
jgi:hypothetical protein